MRFSVLEHTAKRSRRPPSLFEPLHKEKAVRISIQPTDTLHHPIHIEARDSLSVAHLQILPSGTGHRLHRYGFYRPPHGERPCDLTAPPDSAGSSEARAPSSRRRRASLYALRNQSSAGSSRWRCDTSVPLARALHIAVYAEVIPCSDLRGLWIPRPAYPPNRFQANAYATAHTPKKNAIFKNAFTSSPSISAPPIPALREAARRPDGCTST